MGALIAALVCFLAENELAPHDRWEIELLIKKYEKKIIDEKLKERK